MKFKVGDIVVLIRNPAEKGIVCGYQSNSKFLVRVNKTMDEWEGDVYLDYDLVLEEIWNSPLYKLMQED